METIRIAIGTEQRTEIARKVLEYSIKKNCSMPVEFHPLLGEDYQDRGDLGQGTGFSFLRFDTPRFFKYQGRAIYLDADMLVLTDLAELWNRQDVSGNIVWCKLGNEEENLAETSMMLIDCKRAKNKMMSLNKIKEYLKDDVDRKKYREVMKLKYLKPQPIGLAHWWNVMDKGCIYSDIKNFKNPKAKILHYTNVRIQPWFYPQHSQVKIWEKYFKEAFAAGYFAREEVEEAVSKFDMSNSRRPNGMDPYWLEVIK